MGSTPWLSTTSVNSATSTKFRDPSAWERLCNAVAEPVREMIAVEIESAPAARDLIGELVALKPERPHRVIEFDPVQMDPTDLLGQARAAISGWPAEEGLLCLLDISRPRVGEDDAPATAFWQGMNQLRESWDAFDCQAIFFLIPYHYRLLSAAADHLKRWMSLKVHLQSEREDGVAPEGRSLAIDITQTEMARRNLETLEMQLREAINRGEASEVLVRRYYLPMFGAAVSLHDQAKASRIRKKIDAAKISPAELPGWFNVNFNYELSQHRLTEAGVIAESHLRWARGSKDLYEEATALFNSGNLALIRGDFTTAEHLYLESLRICEIDGNEQGEAVNYHQLGIIAYKQRNFAAAEKWYHKALATKRKLGDEGAFASTYHQLGNIADEQGDFAAAETWYLKALTISEKLGDIQDSALTYHQLGNIAGKQGNFVSAEKWYLKALMIFEKLGDELHAAGTCSELGHLSFERQDYLSSWRFAVKALELFSRVREGSEAEVTFRNLVLIYRASSSELHPQQQKLGEETLGKEVMRQIQRDAESPESAST
jgi:tetratricopeptide (TPR) repeat protein